MNKLTAIILAAGESTRMRSRRPKSLHQICGRPLIHYPVNLARALGARVIVVVGRGADDVSKAVSREAEATFVEQRERRGTGHAVLQAREACGDDSDAILVLPGDMPLLSVETIERLVAHHRKSRAAATVLTAVVTEPQGYGRVLRQGGRVKRIVEDRDASDAEKKIAEINTSVYCFAAGRLWSALGKVRSDNDQGEYYLTDVIGVLSRADEIG
jgi:bifunctional UDP-N-acetylglucosamine pyrophosphorylase/glucosamine-1-phosphate N-acetyltransferase